ncbi:MAG: sulfatase-like hydrolase/transferase, partial [Prolixibacteraceae bacterium]|nr:sulfatase-like hydrolase/transferase [Prolixibacteraceae bacterium]
MYNSTKQVKITIFRIWSILGLILLGLIFSCSPREEELSKPNILFIAIDDMNDWVGVLGGHPQAKTPNIDKLASEGILFTNEHTPAP